MVESKQSLEPQFKDVSKLLRRSPWDNRLEILLTPVYEAIPQMAKFAFNRIYANQNYNLLYNLSDRTTDEKVDEVASKIEQMSRQGRPSIDPIDLGHIPGRRSEIIKVKLDPKKKNVTKVQNVLELAQRLDLSVNPNVSLLLPGVIVQMPFGVYAGHSVGEFYGSLYAYSFLQVRWRPTTVGGYIETLTRYGAIRYWDTQSQNKLADLADEVERGQILAHFLQAQRMLHPFPGGAPGLGKKS